MGPTCTREDAEFLVNLTFDFFIIAAMTPNELAAVRERYTEEMFPGLDMPMDQVICPCRICPWTIQIQNYFMISFDHI